MPKTKGAFSGLFIFFSISIIVRRDLAILDAPTKFHLLDLTQQMQAQAATQPITMLTVMAERGSPQSTPRTGMPGGGRPYRPMR
jgi:hypothetical protein